LPCQRTAVPTRRSSDLFYLCQPQPGLLVCATNRSYLAEVLERMQQPAKMRAFPKDLPEWKHVDVKASVWGLRHYRPDRAENAPLDRKSTRLNSSHVKIS